MRFFSCYGFRADFFLQRPPRAGCLRNFDSFCFGLVDTPSHALHSNPELLPRPAILAPMHLHDNSLEFVEPGFRFGPQEVLSNFIPVLFRNLPLLASRLDLIQPFVNWHIFLRVALKDRTVGPAGEHWLQVVWFDFEGLEHNDCECETM